VQPFILILNQGTYRGIFVTGAPLKVVSVFLVK